MAFTFTVETGAIVPGANSFCTVEFADAELEIDVDRFASWSGLTTDVKQKRLAYATRWLCDRVIWRGALVETDQPLAWPRQDAVDRNGNEISEAVVPTEVKRATAQLALHFLTEDAEGDSAGVRRFRADTFEIEYQQTFLGRGGPAFLKHLLLGLGQVTTETGFKPIVKA